MMVPLRSDDDDVFSPAQPATTEASGHVAMAAPTTAAGESTPAGKSTQFVRMPGTPVTREAALAQIRARRDRARSAAAASSSSGRNTAPGTPGGAGSRRDLMGCGIRDVSAPGGY